MGSWATTGGAYLDFVLDVAVDPETEELYAAGKAYDHDTIAHIDNVIDSARGRENRLQTATAKLCWPN